MIDLLTDLEAYFEDRADADYGSEGFEPNVEMNFLTAIRDLLFQIEYESKWVIAI